MLIRDVTRPLVGRCKELGRQIVELMVGEDELTETDKITLNRLRTELDGYLDLGNMVETPFFAYISHKLVSLQTKDGRIIEGKLLEDEASFVEIWDHEFGPMKICRTKIENITIL